jgi:hypothetical protein
MGDVSSRGASVRVWPPAWLTTEVIIWALTAYRHEPA